jgi:large subunit ribosomal protein L29
VAEDLRALTDDELAKQVEEAHRELFNLRFRLSTKQLANHREVRSVKKRIARLKTIIRERELSRAKETMLELERVVSSPRSGSAGVFDGE